MKQIYAKQGKVIIDEVPAPVVSDMHVLLQTYYSVISAGTETRTIKSARESEEYNLLANRLRRLTHPQNFVSAVKRRLSPEYLSQVLKDNADDSMGKLIPLGYSGSGVVVEKGKDIQEVDIGDKIAYGGSGHADFVYVPRNLFVKIPENVNLKEAAFTTLGAIAIHAVRIGRVALGEFVVVIGQGLIGQLVAQVAQASGGKVIVTDLLDARLQLAKKLSAKVAINASTQNVTKEVMNYTNDIGADVVIICASSASSKPVEQALEIARGKGRVVIVGDVKLELPRKPFYQKELEFLISRSYGPGRYDKNYEEEGLDYPIEYVRWTENRNMQEFLDMLSDKKINVEQLITHEFLADDAAKAYETIMDNPENVLGVVLKYDGLSKEDKDLPGRKIEIASVEYKKIPLKKGVINTAVIGCGSFAKSMHLPNLKKIPEYNIYAIASATGSNAKQVAKQYHAIYCTTDYEEIFRDENVDLVIITTRHNLHAPLIIKAAKAGKHIFVEKPMAMTYDECRDVVECVRNSGVKCFVGFNRRFSPLSIEAKQLISQINNPIMIDCRVVSQFLPVTHWIYDTEEGGGRIIGEVCHFFDFLYWLIGSEPTRIFAQGGALSHPGQNIHDNIVVNIEFENGSIASITYGDLGHSSFPKERIEIFAGHLVIVIDNFKDLITYGIKGKNLSLREIDKGHYQELVELSKVFKNNTDSPVSVIDGARVTICCLKTIESIESGMPQKISEQEYS